jgi:O-antigen/teichoic acid export membrane protein
MTPPQELRARVVTGLRWEALARFSGQLVTWCFTFVLMRILNPTDYGLMALAMFFVAFSQMLSEMGLGSALVQARQLDAGVLRKVQGLLWLVNGSICGLLCLGSPAVAALFGEPRLIWMVRALALQFLLIPWISLPIALMLRQMDFRRKAAVELSAALLGGAASLTLALTGFGVWSLVWGSLGQALARAVGANLVQPCLLRPSFSFGGLRRLLSFGGLVTLNDILWFFYSQADVFIVGKLLGTRPLGFYSVGMQIASIPMQRINGVLNQVAFPAFAAVQDEPDKISRYLEKALRWMSLCAFPIFLGIATVAPEAIRLFLGEKWSPAVVPVVLLALSMPIRMLSNLFPIVVCGAGRADISVINILIACAIMPAAMAFGTRWGLAGVCVAWLAAYPVVFAIEIARSRPVTRLGGLDVLRILALPATMGLVMAATVLGVGAALSAFSPPLVLAAKIVSGVAVFAALVIILRRESVRELRALVSG